MAECCDINKLSDIQVQQACLLTESLAAMRVAEKTDVILVCGEKEFFAHKLVLEARSTVFTTMFQSNLEEAKSGKVIFKDMEPETLDAILDFMYVGEVEKMKTDDQLMKVLGASHRMALRDLFQYCCTSLLQMLSPRNFLAIWIVAEKYEAEALLLGIKVYFLGNSTYILTSKDFLDADIKQLKDLVVFFKSKFKNINELCKGIVLWVLHDLPSREQFVDELFAYIDANRVSKKFAKSLLDEGELMMKSKDLANGLKDFVIETCFVEEKHFSEEVDKIEPSKIETTSFKICGGKLFYLMQETVAKLNDGSRNVQVQSETVATYIQLFALDTMSWQPMKQLPSLKFKVDAVCQHNDCIFMVGSTAGNLYLLYDMSKNALQYVNTSNNLCEPNASLCSFRNKIYLVGGTEGNGTTPNVPIWLNLGSRTWSQTLPLNSSCSKPYLLASENCLFVTGVDSSLSQQFVEYTDGIAKRTNVYGENGEKLYRIGWSRIDLPNDILTADIHFFPSNEGLGMLCDFSGAILKLTYNHFVWSVEELTTNQHHGELKVKRVSHFSAPEKPFLLICMTDSTHGIPNCILELASNKWTKLPEQKGVCEIKKWEEALTSTWCPLEGY